jgi:hypothetical protein
MFRFTCLRHKLIFSILLPTALFLAGFGLLGFLYARHNLMEKWRDAAILRLERVAHQLDMRLKVVLNWAELFARSIDGGIPKDTQDWIIGQIRDLEGVTEVTLVWGSEHGPGARDIPPGQPPGGQVTDGPPGFFMKRGKTPSPWRPLSRARAGASWDISGSRWALPI